MCIRDRSQTMSYFVQSNCQSLVAKFLATTNKLCGSYGVGLNPISTFWFQILKNGIYPTNAVVSETIIHRDVFQVKINKNSMFGFI